MPDTIQNGGHVTDPDTGAPIQRVTLPDPVAAPPPRSLQEAATRIQRDAEDLKGVIPWLEVSPLLTDEQRLQVLYAHWGLTTAAYLLEEALGLAYGKLFAAGGNKGGGSGSGGGG